MNSSLACDRLLEPEILRRNASMNAKITIESRARITCACYVYNLNWVSGG